MMSPVEQDHARRDLLDLLSGHLPPTQFNVVVLLFGLDGGGFRSYAEVALALHITVATVKGRRIDALRTLARVEGLKDFLRSLVPHEQTAGRVHTVSNHE